MLENNKTLRKTYENCDIFLAVISLINEFHINCYLITHVSNANVLIERLEQLFWSKTDERQ